MPSHWAIFVHFYGHNASVFLESSRGVDPTQDFLLRIVHTGYKCHINAFWFDTHRLAWVAAKVLSALPYLTLVQTLMATN